MTKHIIAERPNDYRRRWEAFDPMRYHEYGNLACPECNITPILCKCGALMHIRTGSYDDGRRWMEGVCEGCGALHSEQSWLRPWN